MHGLMVLLIQALSTDGTETVCLKRILIMHNLVLCSWVASEQDMVTIIPSRLKLLMVADAQAGQNRMKLPLWLLL